MSELTFKIYPQPERMVGLRLQMEDLTTQWDRRWAGDLTGLSRDEILVALRAAWLVWADVHEEHVGHELAQPCGDAIRLVVDGGSTYELLTLTRSYLRAGIIRFWRGDKYA